MLTINPTTSTRNLSVKEACSIAMSVCELKQDASALFTRPDFYVPYAVQLLEQDASALYARIENKQEKLVSLCESAKVDFVNENEYGLLLSSVKICSVIREYETVVDSVKMLKKYAQTHSIDLQGDLPSIFACAVTGKWNGKTLAINIGNLKVAMNMHKDAVLLLADGKTSESTKEAYNIMRRELQSIYRGLDIDGVMPNSDSINYLLTLVKAVLKIDRATLSVRDKGVKIAKDNVILKMVCTLVVRDYTAKRLAK